MVIVPPEGERGKHVTPEHRATNKYCGTENNAVALPVIAPLLLYVDTGHGALEEGEGRKRWHRLGTGRKGKHPPAQAD